MFLFNTQVSQEEEKDLTKELIQQFLMHADIVRIETNLALSLKIFEKQECCSTFNILGEDLGNKTHTNICFGKKCAKQKLTFLHVTK